jgi:hypothetical protein
MPDIPGRTSSVRAHSWELLNLHRNPNLINQITFEKFAV